MIVEMVISALVGVLLAVLEALPDLTLPVGTYPDQFANLIGGSLGGLDGFLPITEMSVVVSWALVTYVPVCITYYVVRWVYTHLPVIGNGG